jgi:NADPH-dependent glutamate synthase beta subunit-like oxidoreductase
MTKLNLGFDISFEDLYSHEGLKKLDKAYLSFLKRLDSNLLEKLLFLREENLEKKDYSNFIIEYSAVLEKFLIELFPIQKSIKAFSKHKDNFEKLYKCKKLFVQRKVLLRFKATDLDGFDVQIAYDKIFELLSNDFSELAFAIKVIELLSEDKYNDLELFSKYTAWVCLTEDGRKRHKDWIIFQNPRKFVDEHQLDLEETFSEGIKVLHEKTANFIDRDGFSLTSERYGIKETLDQANYCIHCHKTDKDSCSKGMTEKRSDGEFQIKRNIYGDELSGCPLNEKISEMHLLKTNGFHLASLATAIIDNPMLAATGYRICNECMKSCIYQKQDPVNIPKAETGVLRDILNLPWGFEIYRLLTQWNPLKLKDYITKPDSGKKILVVGMGPAGFTLAHYLLTEGHTVVAIDGLKIEPVDSKISGIECDGKRVAFAPIRDIEEITDDLDDRISYGFGGVAEYGITVRWDKNFLKIIRLILERNKNFRMYGGIRFGSNVNYNIAHNLGFDHIALSLGAGRPNLLNIPNALALGVRTASDFLMGLQLTGAAKKSSIANLQLRLPVVVVGGGLTAVDTATEAIAYYIREVEKFYDRYIKLCQIIGKKEVELSWNAYDYEIASEFIAHAKLIIEERNLANSEQRNPNFIKIVRDLGGVKNYVS